MFKQYFTPLLLLFFTAGCAAQANFGDGAEQRKTQEIEFNKSYDQVYKTVMQTAGEENWKITHSEKEAGIIQAETPENMSRWGDEVSISLIEKDDTVLVRVKSNLANKPNREYINEFLNMLDSKL